jgi:hypothetical protein
VDRELLVRFGRGAGGLDCPETIPEAKITKTIRPATGELNIFPRMRDDDNEAKSETQGFAAV